MKPNWNMFVYYYFLGRKYGLKPSVACKWAIDFCHWWEKKERIPGKAGLAPSIPKPV